MSKELSLLDTDPTVPRELRAIVREPEDPPPMATLVLLHGRGSGPEEFLAAMTPIRSGEFRVVCPQAPFAHPGGGWMWYTFTGGGADEATLMVTMKALERLTEALCEIELTHVPTYLVGFSQGATVSLAFASYHPERVRAVVALSGFLVSAPALPGPLSSLKGKKILMSHGKEDMSVPFAWGEAAKERLMEAGADVEFVAHEGGHAIPPTVLKKTREWIVEDIRSIQTVLSRRRIS